MMRRPMAERVARVEQRLALVAMAAFFLLGIWGLGGLTMGVELVGAALVGFTLRPAATAIVSRRVSLWALLGDGEESGPVALPRVHGAPPDAGEDD